MQCLVGLKSDPDASIPYTVCQSVLETFRSDLFSDCRAAVAELPVAEQSFKDGDGQGVTYVTPLLHDKAMYMQ